MDPYLAKLTKTVMKQPNPPYEPKPYKYLGNVTKSNSAVKVLAKKIKGTPYA